MARIGADNRHALACPPVVREGKIASTGAQVENRGRSGGRHQPRCLPAPVFINVETQQMIEQVVAWGDGAEHAPDAGLTFIEGWRAHLRVSK